MTTSFVLTILLLICMTVIGGKKGLISFVSLFINIASLVVALVAIIIGIPIYIVAIIFCIAIAALNLFVLNGYNKKTLAAFIATILSTLLLISVVYLTIEIAQLQGFVQEQQDETAVFSAKIGIDFVQFMTFAVLLAVIAAIIDLAITISSPIYELNEANPNLTLLNLFQSGINIGKEILSTSINTIYFAYLGAELTLIFWFFNLHYSFERIINAKVFAQEFLTILLGVLGIIISIPITAILTAWLVKKQSKNSAQ